MVVAQNRQKPLGKGWQSHKKTLEVGGGEDRNCTITKQYRFKKQFSRRPSRMAGKASVKLLIRITQRTKNKHFSIDTDTVTYNS